MQIIGFDFDGVLHTDVTSPDIEQQRHPTSLKPPLKPFVLTIDLIKRYISAGNIVYIVTAHSPRTIVTNLIKSHLDQYGLSILSDKIYYTFGADKSNTLNKLKINIFYDDSCLRIRQIYRRMLDQKLPHMKHLYLAVPEKEKFIEINSNSIYETCIESSMQIINSKIRQHQYVPTNPLINEKLIELAMLVNKQTNTTPNRIICLQLDIVGLILPEIKKIEKKTSI